MTSRVILLLGRADPISDGVVDYCRFLSAELTKLGHRTETVLVDWTKIGRVNVLREIVRIRRLNPDVPIVAQYTPLSWSRRGFPFYALVVALSLSISDGRSAWIVHDPTPDGGNGPVGMVRRTIQRFVLTQLPRLARRVFVTVPPGHTPLGEGRRNTHWLPIGTNIPVIADDVTAREKLTRAETPFVVAVFGISRNSTARREVSTIAAVLQIVIDANVPVRLRVFGRSPAWAERALAEDLPPHVDFEHLGLVSEQIASRILNEADAFLFLRGAVSPRRGSLIAALAHGLPIVGYLGIETAAPLDQVGLVLPVSAPYELGQALLQLATDSKLRARIADTNRAVHDSHFSWQTIASILEGHLENL